MAGTAFRRTSKDERHEACGAVVLPFGFKRVAPPMPDSQIRCSLYGCAACRRQSKPAVKQLIEQCNKITREALTSLKTGTSMTAGQLDTKRLSNL